MLSATTAVYSALTEGNPVRTENTRYDSRGNIIARTITHYQANGTGVVDYVVESTFEFHDNDIMATELHDTYRNDELVSGFGNTYPPQGLLLQQQSRSGETLELTVTHNYRYELDAHENYTLKEHRKGQSS